MNVTKPANLQMKPTHPVTRPIMAPWRAAHLHRSAMQGPHLLLGQGEEVGGKLNGPDSV
jgi:hypothetical protein